MTPCEIAKLIDRIGSRIINVAGNRESVCPGIERVTYKTLLATFKILKDEVKQ